MQHDETPPSSRWVVTFELRDARDRLMFGNLVGGMTA
jgi:hypothetical protein